MSFAENDQATKGF